MPLIHTDPRFRHSPIAHGECRARIAWPDYHKLSHQQREWLDMLAWDIVHTASHWEGSIAASRLDEIAAMENN